MTTLVERLFAAERGGAWFVPEGAETAPFVPWPVIAHRASRIAGGLAAEGMRPGDPVGLVVPEGRPFLEAFLGVTLAGGVPAPMFPPLGLSSLDAWSEGAGHALRAARARFLVGDGEVTRIAAGLVHDVPTLRAVLSVSALDAPTLVVHEDPSRPAILQLTSGSTSRPTLVRVMPSHLAANVAAFNAGIGGTSDDICASWLPLYHDMGLVGHALGSIWADGRLALLNPLAFLKRPSSWLRLIHRHQATVSFAPNFAYGLVDRRTSEEERSKLDLSSWRIAGCGAEPIDPATLRRFASSFASCGFRETAFLPCYGLAEHTLAATFPPPGRGLVVERGFVGCGRPFPGHTVRVLDVDGAEVPEGQVGEIAVSGPSVTTPGELRTGDQGFVDGGELFVCGRLKDLIIVRGRNHHPHDLERLACAVDGVRPGGAAAFSVPGPDGEVPVLVVEIADPRPDLPQAVATAVQDATGLRVQVVVVGPRTLPKTSSGKVRRSEARARHLAGTLELVYRGRGAAWHLTRAQLGRARAAVRSWVDR